jgi:hypothetical protein
MSSRLATQGIVDITLRLNRLIALLRIQLIDGLIGLVVGDVATTDLTGAATTISQ